VEERQTENLKVRSSILLIGSLFEININLLIYYQFKNNNFITYLTSTIKKPNKNAYYYLLYLHENNKKKLFKELFQLYNLQYLQNFYNVSLREKNINAISVLPKEVTNYILYKTINQSYKAFKIKYFNEVLCLFLVNIFLKNSKNVCKFIKKKLESVHFKEHRKYFLFFIKILKKYVKNNFTILKVSGVVLKFKGKLGKGGNSRTKTMYFKAGKTSQGDRGLCLNNNK